MRKLAIAAIVGGVFSLGSAAVVADTGSPFPKDNSLDYAVQVGTSDINSPFPKDNSIDHAVRMPA